jgi:hypothetical protein
MPGRSTAVGNPTADMDGFAMPGTECGWYGVRCSEDRVTELQFFFNNNLEGRIPVELGNLTNLGLN